MADQTTFIKLDRNIMEWRWYQDANTFRIFVHMIMKANIRDHDFEGITIHRGELATSLPSLSNDLKISIQSCRTALNHLKSTGEVTCRKYPHYQVITIVNYELYQSSLTGRSTGGQQATNRQLTGDQHQSKNGKNGRRERRKNIFSAPTVDQVLAFAKSEQLPMSQKDAEQFIWYNTAHSWKGITDWQALVRMRASQLGDDAADPEETEERRET